jgi:hypothetical protein
MQCKLVGCGPGKPHLRQVPGGTASESRGGFGSRTWQWKALLGIAAIVAVVNGITNQVSYCAA